MLPTQDIVDKELTYIRLENPGVICTMLVDDNGLVIGSSLKEEEINEMEVAAATALVHAISTLMETRVKSGHFEVDNYKIIFSDVEGKATLVGIVHGDGPLVKYVKAMTSAAKKISEYLFNNSPLKRSLFIRELKEKLLARKAA
ncbi:MAG: hypothetical protein QXL15_02330 [Candidatus Korarchaeota archaeon]